MEAPRQMAVGAVPITRQLRNSRSLAVLLVVGEVGIGGIEFAVSIGDAMTAELPAPAS